MSTSTLSNTLTVLERIIHLASFLDLLFSDKFADLSLLSNTFGGRFRPLELRSLDTHIAFSATHIWWTL
jgi:hypothetical protein